MPNRPQLPLPTVTLKAAVTLDGRIAGRGGDSKWITGDAARRYAHRLRAQHDAVLVGVGTVLADDPELTVRLVKGRDPIRVVLDSSLRTPLSSKVVKHSSKAPTWLMHGPGASKGRIAKLQGLPGVERIAHTRVRDTSLSPREILKELAKRGVRSVLLEGGSKVHGAFLDAGLVDRVAVFVAPVILGDARGIPLSAGKGVLKIADAFRLREVKTKKLGDDVLFTGTLVTHTLRSRGLARGGA